MTEPTPAEIAEYDQHDAAIREAARDSTVDAIHITAYYTALRSAGVSQVLANRLTEAYAAYLFHCCDIDDEDE